MPVLYQRLYTNDFYIRANIYGKIITLQLTKTGKQRLKNACYRSGQFFPYSLLLDLYRWGDVFTRKSFPGKVLDNNQTEIDFSTLYKKLVDAEFEDKWNIQRKDVPKQEEPMMEASSRHAEIVAVLRNRKMDSAIDNEGVSSLILADLIAHTEMAKLLRDKGAIYYR